eukprot:gene24388-9992_t
MGRDPRRRWRRRRGNASLRIQQVCAVHLQLRHQVQGGVGPDYGTRNIVPCHATRGTKEHQSQVGQGAQPDPSAPRGDTKPHHAHAGRGAGAWGTMPTATLGVAQQRQPRFGRRETRAQGLPGGTASQRHRRGSSLPRDYVPRART